MPKYGFESICYLGNAVPILSVWKLETWNSSVFPKQRGLLPKTLVTFIFCLIQLSLSPLLPPMENFLRGIFKFCFWIGVDNFLCLLKEIQEFLFYLQTAQSWRNGTKTWKHLTLHYCFFLRSAFKTEAVLSTEGREAAVPRFEYERKSTHPQSHGRTEVAAGPAPQDRGEERRRRRDSVLILRKERELSQKMKIA